MVHFHLFLKILCRMCKKKPKTTANNGGRGCKTGIALEIKHNGGSKNWALDVNKGRKRWMSHRWVNRRHHTLLSKALQCCTSGFCVIHTTPWAPLLNAETQANICINRERQQLPPPHSPLMVYFRHSSAIHTHRHRDDDCCLGREGWARRSVHGVWRGKQEGRRGRREEEGRRRWGWEGVSQHAAPLGRRASTSFLVLPLKSNMLLR